MDSKECVKLDGQTEAKNARLYKNTGIEFSNMIINMDSWFLNMCCAEFLREELGWNNYFMVNIGEAGTPKDDMTTLLESNTFPKGTHVVY